MNRPMDLHAAAWSTFVNTLVNVPRRFVAERPHLGGLARQGTLAHLLFVAATRPRLTVPVTAVPEFRRGELGELLEVGECLPCTHDGRPHVAPVLLLDAARQLPASVRDPLVAADPIAEVWPAWLAAAPAPRPLTVVADEVLAHAREAGQLAVTAARLALVAAELQLPEIAALVRGHAADTAPRRSDGARSDAPLVRS